MSRDLSSSFRFLEIAELYAKVGRRDAALDWAERGIKAYVAAAVMLRMAVTFDEGGRFCAT